MDANELFELAQRHEKGDGVDVDLKKAAELYQQASDLGHGLAAKNLGSMYEYGKYFAKDMNKAALFYQRSADLGND